MKLLKFSIGIVVALMLIVSCSGEKEIPENQQAPAVTTAADKPAPPPATPEKHYVFDGESSTIYEIDLTDNTISRRYLTEKNLKVIAYDPGRQVIYKGFTGETPGLQVFDPQQDAVVKTVAFPEPVSDMLYHPLKHRLYIISEDSTNFKVFNCDSLIMEQDFPLHVIDKGFVGPVSIEPGPAGKLITANGDRAGITQIFTESSFMYQTVTNSLAGRIDNAVFSFDGKASYSCDTRKGMLFKIQFGSGEILAQLDKLDRPRSVQFEVRSKTVVVATGDTDVLMLHADTFTEMGKVSLAQHGDMILQIEIPPKANFAEVLMEYKGVKRWLRFDVSNWEVLRLVELI